MMKFLFKNSEVNVNINAPEKTVEKSKEEVKEKLEKGEFEIQAEVINKNEEKRIVYGWASVIEVDGQEVVDKHEHIIEVDELVNAAHKYMIESREAHEMHKGEPKGVTVESIVLTEDVQKALGVDLGKVGWFIAQKIYDDETWEGFKSGKYKAFSIGGTAYLEDA